MLYVAFDIVVVVLCCLFAQSFLGNIISFHCVLCIWLEWQLNPSWISWILNIHLVYDTSVMFMIYSYVHYAGYKKYGRNDDMCMQLWNHYVGGWTLQTPRQIWAQWVSKKDINKVIKKREEMRTLRLFLQLIFVEYTTLINLSKRRDTVRSFSNLTIKVELVK